MTPPRKSTASRTQHDIDESLWSSPAKEDILSVQETQQQNRHGRKPNMSQKTSTVGVEGHEQRLQQELASVRKVNEAIEGVLESLEKAKSKMSSVNQTVNNASSLLNIWTRVLSQTEHNQRLILNPSWQGASQDMIDIEEEAVAKQEAAEQQELAERERRAAAAREAEEEEKRKRVETVAPKPRGTTRGRGVGRSVGSTRTESASAKNTSSVNTSNISRTASTRAPGSTATRRATGGSGLRGRG